MSIVRQGLAEDSKFAAGYEAIFGNKTAKAAKKPTGKKKPTAKKKPAAKKK